ncbi:MAG: DUF2017 domain-containing protein [Acidimicrobiia bacterium]|nr:DUF2017 domain-containing protein [Acidimicrobiia bacterium]
MFRRRFRRSRHGVAVSLAPDEARVLRDLPTELRRLLESGLAAGDSALDRLFPRAYLDPTEEEAEAEWQRFAHPELLAGRMAALDLLTAGLDGARKVGGRTETLLDEEATAAWLGVLNDLRLALGARLGVTEDTDLEALDPGDPAVPALSLYGWLTELQGELVDVLLSG